MKSVFATIGLLVLFAVPVFGQPPQAPNVSLTTTVMWDLLNAAQCEAPCSYEVTLDGIVIASSLTVGSHSFPKPGPGLHIIEIVAIDGQMRRSAVSSKSWVETAGVASGPCTYIAPGGSVMETRPVGQMMQGFNPIGVSGVVNNQADRIRLLKTWGWTVDLAQFVEGNLRADKIDRLFLIVRCVGLSQ
jgi:hypothetical protein